ncbi:hypothetical protein FSP39_004745 [Pinctada imbricata]|uniref:HEPN domain-containing protein n=1 Tax=Pinctada imbricata TaxID=66713 RepID=A0AA89C2J1_PINIB|nr:hypothetical protein FSP39_004745 [Pinctada imbricata]
MEFSVGIDDGVEGCDTLCSVRSKREDFKEQLEILEKNLADSNDSLVNDEPLVMSYVLPITLKTDTGEVKLNQWLIVHYFHQGDMDRRMNKLISDTRSKYRPYMGIAAPISSALDKGEIFCLLPLPSQSESQTGLPVHVNGFLALDSNRNHIKWATQDQERSHSHKDDDLVWNELMIRNIFPKVYTKFLEEIRKLSEAQGGSKDLLQFFYRSLPRRNCTKENWMDVIDHVLKHVLATGLPCLKQELWFDCMTSVFSMFEDEIDEATKVSILQLYDISGIHTIHIEGNEDVYHELKKLCPTLRSTSPKDFRNFMRTNSEYKRCSSEDKGRFLAFAISDGNIAEMKGLELIPLHNSEGPVIFDSFRERRRSGSEIFSCEKGEEEILLDFDHSLKVVATNIAGNVADSIRKLRRSGYYQIGAMNTCIFARHLSRTLGRRIPQNKIIAIESHDLGKNWLQKLWSYLKSECSSDLSEFVGLPIVPTLIPSQDGYVKLCEMVDSLISYTDDEADILWRALYVLGIHAVSESELSQFLHPKLYPGHGYVRRFSSNEVKTLLTKTEKERIRDLIRMANEDWTFDDRMQIVDFMKGMVDTSDTAKQIILNMNIFQTKTAADDLFNDEYVSIKKGFPLYVGDSDFPVGFPKTFIVTNDTTLREIARKLGTTFLNTEDVIMMCLNHFHSSHHGLRRLCFYILERKDSFSKREYLISRLQSISFVKKNKEEYERPCQLFCPDDSSLRNLFAKQDMIPFEESKQLELLMKAGILLTKKDVREKHILVVCKFLNNNCSISNTDKEMIIKKANTLLEISSGNPKLKAMLESPECQNLRFIPNRQKPPSSYPETLPWFQSTSLLFSPSELVTAENGALLVGSVAPVISPNCPKDFNSIGREPYYMDVLQQLQHALVKFSVEELEEYKIVLSSIYKFLNISKIPSDSFVRANLPKRYILLGDTFVEPENVYCETRKEDLRLDPYLNPLPADLKRQVQVFLKYNEYRCFKFQTPESQIKVLHQIKLKHNGKRCLPDSEVERDLNICNDILTNICRKKLSMERMEIVLPIDSMEKGQLIFAEAKDCSYCGTDWLSKAYRDSEALNFVHQKIPRDVAEYFGVKSVKQKIANATDMLPQAEFGQSEDLTTRLRNLLSDGYTDGFSVPKEIVQNADDAGATVVRFLYDERENKEFRSFLLDDEMKECQGPALWAYNDKQFSKNDFANIQKISGATKKGDTTKIGRFGLGFNAVYNITDVPCFISGNNIAYFDPHRKFLRDAFQSEQSTGILLDLSQSQLMANFRDQFQPFVNVFGFHPEQEHTSYAFNGTIFRFHLRTKKQAKESGICRVHYTRNEMIKLLRMLFESAGNLLLFTQNVQEVSLHYLQNGSTNPDDDMVLVFKIRKEEIFQPLLDTRNILTTATQILTKAKPHDGSKTTQRFICRTSMTMTTGIGLTEVVDGKTDGDKVESEWLISWSLGRSNSLRLYKDGDSDGALPLTAVALPFNGHKCLHMKDVSVGFYKESHLFVYLPLPVKVPFPLHVNGSFAVSADRRRLLTHTSDDKSDSRQVNWNSALIGDSLLHSYLQFLVHIGNYCLHDVREFYYLWPTDCGHEGTWKPLLKDFYRTLTEKEGLKMFFGLRNNESAWLAFEECTFLDESFSNDTKIYSLVFTVLKRLAKKHRLCPVELPQTIRQSFIKAGLCSELKRRTMSKFTFYELFLPNIGELELDLEDKQQLVIYALRQENKNLAQLLMANACITSKPRKNFHLPSELVHPNSRWKTLFVIDDERFPSEAFCKEEILESLQSIGMLTTELPWDLIRLQAKTNKDLHARCTECSRERTKTILKYIHENHINDRICPKEVYEELSEIEFIPAMTKSDEWVWKWKADEYITESKVCNSHRILGQSTKLIKPKHLFFSGLELLVGCSELLTPNYINGYKEELLKLGVRGDNTVELRTLLKQLEHLSFGHSGSKVVSDSLELRVLETVFRALEIRCHDVDAKSLLNKLINQPTVKIGRRFVSPSSVVFSLKHDCSPFLYGLDNNPLLKFKNALESMGVRQKFELQTVKNVLKQLKETKQPLSESEVGLACRVALLLEEFDHLDLSELYLPDSDGVLRPTSELCTDDCPWIPKTETMKFLHGDIPQKIAEMTGIRSKRTRDVTDESSEFGIDFGQHEDLTNRIKRILDGYPEVCIMKELLQNADDAGATELHFIKDFREHGIESVFSEEWKDLQGPALCVYNDSVFSEKDLEGIQNLGIGSKGEDPTSTGQYGVGFNVVYHLTDVPTFLTKDTFKSEKNVFCVLDPQCHYIPCATQRRPGRRFDDPSNTKMKYPDVFSGYLEDLEAWDKKGGTMFRFPLRKRCSEISSNVIHKERLNDLIEEFKHEMTHSLLFLHNVRRISISSVDKYGALINEHYAESNISGESGNDIYKAIVDTRTKIRENEVVATDVQRLETSYIITLTTDGQTETSEDLLIVQSLGFSNRENVPRSIKDACKTNKIGLLPQGGVAIPLRNRRRQVYNTEKQHVKDIKRKFEEMSNSMGSTEEFSKDIDSKMHVYCYLPLPINTGLPVHINGHFALDYEARRNVWWPDGSLKQDLKKEWNSCLMREVIAPAYASGLEQLRQILFPSRTVPKAIRKLDEYHNAFPNIQMQTDNIWKLLAAMLYKHVNENEIYLFPVTRFPFETDHLQSVPKQKKLTNKSKEDIERNISEESCQIEWVALGCPDCPAYYNDLYRQVRNDSMEKHDPYEKKSRWDIYKEASKEAEQLGVILKNLGLNLLDIPSWIYQSIIDSEVHISAISPITVLEFMKTFKNFDNEFKCKIESVDVPIKETVLRSVTNADFILWYCALNLEAIKSELEGCPLLVTADEYLRVFSSEKDVFVTDDPRILPSSGSVLVHELLIYHVKDYKGNLFYPNLVRHLSLEDFSQLFPGNFYTDMCKGYDMVPWTRGQNQHLNNEWMTTFWSFIANEFEMNQTRYLTEKMEHFEESLEKKKKDHSPILISEMRESKSKEFSYEGKQKFLAKMTELLGKWNLLPVTNGDAAMLCRLDRSKLLVFDSQTGGHRQFKDAFSHLKIPKPDRTAIDALYVPFYRSPYSNIGMCFVASFLDPVSVLNCLYEYRNTFQNLSVKICNQILAYLVSSICKDYGDGNSSQRDCGSDESLKQRIRSLPFFLTLSGNIISIEDKSTVLVLPDTVPKTGIEIWSNVASITLLCENYDLRRLHTYVGCVMEEPFDLYCNRLLPAFRDIPDESVIAHIQFIKESLYPQRKTCDKNGRLKSCLSKAEFVIISKQRHSAKLFYDPSVKLFKTMCRTDELPPEPFSFDDWREFMSFSGLQHEVTEDIIITMARRLENEEQTAEQITEAISKKSDVLLEALQEMPDVCDKRYCLQKISGIRILVPHEISDEKKCLLSSEIQVNRLVAYSASTTLDYENVCWTTFCIIPENANPARWYYLGNNARLSISNNLQIKCPPPDKSIVQHIKGLSKRFTQNQELLRDEGMKQDFIEVMQNIYRFLSKSFMSDLANVPIIYIKGRNILSCASSVVLDMSESDEIPPYLFKAPLFFGEFFNLFRRLGASESLSCNHYAKVLGAIYSETKRHDCLHAEELKKVMKAVQNLFRMLQTSSNKDALSVNELHLPSKDKILLPCKELVFVDDTMIQKRIKQNITEINYFVGFAALELNVDDPVRHIKLLPEKLQPTMLSKAIIESIPNELKEQTIDSARAKRMEEFLSSSRFLQGVLRLIMHKKHKCEDILSDDEHQEIKSQLLQIEVVELKFLQTCLYWNNEMLPGTEQHKKIFFEFSSYRLDVEEGEQTSVLYFSESSEEDLEDWVRSIHIELSQYINICIGQKLEENVIYLSEMLKCINDPEEIQFVLDRHEIVGMDISLEIDDFLPKLGSEIPIKLHYLLDNSFSFYDEGEYVALEIYDPFIDDENTAASLEGDEEATMFSPVYILARVIERLTLQDKDVTEIEYKLDIGESFETAKASRIYKFVRKEIDGDSALDYVDGAKVINWDMDAVKKYILSIMKDAAKKPKSEMRRIVKRLLLQYHPDKHTENKQYFTELTQFIQYLVSKIERGESLDDVDLGEMQRDNRRNCDSTFCEGMFRRGRRYAEQRSDNSSSGSSFFDAFRHAGPQPGQARRWIRQAEIDLRAANNDSHDDKAQNWVCYKCHQASEKALKALLYKVGSDDMVLKSHRLPQLASSTHDAELIGLAGSLEDNTGSYFRMRYPDAVGGFSDITGCRIPSDIYTRDQAERAVHLATSIVQLVQAKL